LLVKIRSLYPLPREHHDIPSSLTDPFFFNTDKILSGNLRAGYSAGKEFKAKQRAMSSIIQFLQAHMWFTGG
jgi:hypothetical protein